MRNPDRFFTKASFACISQGVTVRLARLRVVNKAQFQRDLKRHIDRGQCRSCNPGNGAWLDDWELPLKVIQGQTFIKIKFDGFMKSPKLFFYEIASFSSF